MKHIVYTIGLIIMLCVLTWSCEKDEVGSFEAKSAINFVKDSIQYSFIQETADEHIIEIPVAVIGDTTSYDRFFEVTIEEGASTTASSDLYKIMEGKIAAGEFSGNLLVKVKKDPILDDTSVSILITGAKSEDFEVGNVESNRTKLIWTNKVVVPAWTYFRYFFTRYPSTAAYRAFIASTGLTDFTRNDYIYVYGPTGAQALGKAFGDYIRQYEIDNGEPLLHDDGDHAGEEIIPIY